MNQTINVLVPMTQTNENFSSSTGVHIPRHRQITVKYIGHSCYLIIAPDGTRVVTDPYGDFPPVPFPILSADLVTISHNHIDHNANGRIGGHPMILDVPAEKTMGMVKIKSFTSSHPEYRGIKCPNLIFCFQIGGIKLVHLGELGEPPSTRVTEAIQDADVIFFSIGFTDGLRTLKAMYRYIFQLNPKFIIPGHYSPSAEERWFGMATIDEFVNIVLPETRIVTAEELTLNGGFQTAF